MSHLNRLFHPLQFPPELARRVLTHGSHKDAVSGHNARFSFLGRRVLEAYLLLFLHSTHSNTIPQPQDHTLVLERTLNTYVLGEHVAPKWHLEPHIRWAPSLSADKLIQRAINTIKSQQEQQVEEQAHDTTADEPLVDLNQLGPRVVKSVGMHKVHGDIVQGIIGAIYHQFGASTAHRIFHTRLLPHLVLPDSPVGLPTSLHQHTLQVCEEMGGADGPLRLAAI